MNSFDSNETIKFNHPAYIGKFKGFRVDASEVNLVPTHKYNGRRRIYRLDKDFWIVFTYTCGRQEFCVKAGEETDFATIPIFLQIVLGNRDAVGILEASIIHDLLCRLELPRSITMAYMWVAMVSYKVPSWKRYGFLFGLMLFGYNSWPSNIFKKIKASLFSKVNNHA